MYISEKDYGRLFLLATAGLLLLEPYCLQLTWNWHVPYIFTSAPTLTYGAAFGLSMITALLLLKPDYIAAQVTEETKFNTSLLHTGAVIVITIVAYIAHTLAY